MLTKVIFWPVVMCTFVPWLTEGRLMVSDSNNGKKSNFRRRWEIKGVGGADRNGHGTKESRRLT